MHNFFYYTEYDYDFRGSATVVHSAGVGGVFHPFFIPVYDDGISEDVEGLVLFFEVLESELDPRDVDFISHSRSTYLIVINPSDMHYRYFDVTCVHARAYCTTSKSWHKIIIMVELTQF